MTKSSNQPHSTGHKERKERKQNLQYENGIQRVFELEVTHAHVAVPTLEPPENQFNFVKKNVQNL